MMIVSVCWQRCTNRGLVFSRSKNIAQATLVSGEKSLTCRRTSSYSHQAPPHAKGALVVTSHYVDTAHAPEDYEDGSAVVYENFITPEEGEALASDLKVRLKRRRYEKGHWDAVIVKYKETELYDEATFLSPTSQHVFDRVREHLLAEHFEHPSTVKWLPCHAIDYHKDGELNPHVDSVRYSGEIVSGLSLLSSGIMRLRPAPEEDMEEDDDNCDNRGDDDGYSRTAVKHDDEGGYVDLLLPPLSLYVLAGVSRYNYTHELLPSGAAFNDKVIERDHRLSVIFRDAKNEG